MNRQTFFPAGMQSVPAGPKIVLVPCIYIICLSALRRYHAVYTRIGRMHSLEILVRRTSESKDNVYKKENLASIAIKQIQCQHWLPKTILGCLF